MAGFGLALAWFLLLDLPPLPLSHGVPAPKAPLHPHPPQQPCKVSEILPTIINIIVIIIMHVILMCNCMAAESQLISMRISGWGGGSKKRKTTFPAIRDRDLKQIFPAHAVLLPRIKCACAC